MAQSDNPKSELPSGPSSMPSSTPDHSKDDATPEAIRELIRSGKLKQYDTLDELWHDLSH